MLPRYPLDVQPDDEISFVKVLVESLTGVPIERQRLLGLKGGPLLANSTLRQLEIAENQVLLLLGKPEEAPGARVAGTALERTCVRRAPPQRPDAARAAPEDAPSEQSASTPPSDPQVLAEIENIGAEVDRLDEQQRRAVRAVAELPASTDADTRQRAVRDARNVGFMLEKVQLKLDLVSERAGHGDLRNRCKAITKRIQQALQWLDSRPELSGETQAPRL